MSSNPLFNIDIIAPKKEDIKYLGEITKLNIFEFSGSSEFEQEGFFSTRIYGPVGSTERNESFGFINIGMPILHPKVYQNFLALGANIVNLILGKERCIFKNGEFIPDESGGTGLYFFLEYWKDLKVSDNNSDQRRAMIELNEKYGTEDWLTQYILVLPAGMRDYIIKNGRPSEDEINNLYRSLLSASMVLKNNNINIKSKDIELYNSIVISLQEKFVDVYDYIKNILEGKTGYLQNQWSKHGVKYATRNVITSTATIVDNLNSDNIVKPTDTIVGLHQWMSGISPAAKREIVNIISNVIDGESSKAYLYNPKTLKPELTDLKYKEVNNWTTFEGLDKIFKKFGQDNIKTLPVTFSNKYLGLIRDDGKNIELYFNDEVEDLTNVRPLTYFELFYIALYDIRNNFTGVLTRFPVESMTSSYFTTIYLKTTTDDRKVEFKFGNVSKTIYNYPILSSPPYNSLTPHFTRLEGIGGDNDGDTVSLIMILLSDTVEESRKMLLDIKYYIKPDGTLMNFPSIPPADLLMKHLTTSFDFNNIIIDLSDYKISVDNDKVNHRMSTVAGKKIDDEYFIESNTTLLITEKEDIKAFVKYKYLNKYLSDKKYSKYGNMTRSDYYVLIEEAHGSENDIIILITKLLEETYNGFDSISITKFKGIERVGYKDTKEVFIRFAV